MRYRLRAELFDEHDNPIEVGFGESDNLPDAQRRADDYVVAAGGPPWCTASVVDTETDTIVYESSTRHFLVPAMFYVPNSVALTASEAREHVVALLEDNDYVGVSYLTVGDEKDVTAEGGLPAWP